MILDLWPSHFVSGRLCLSDMAMHGDFSPCTVLDDVLRVKSTSTLMTRAGPLLRFASWAKERGVAPWPLLEKDVYFFLGDMRSKSCAATFCSSFLSSVNFASAMLGLDGGFDCLSRRVSGLAHGEL